MMPWWLRRSVFERLIPGKRADNSGMARARGSVSHVIILDGTMSSLKPGEETNAGLTYKLLSEMGAQVSLFYEAGLQWKDWRSTKDVMMGRGINRQIRRAYGYLASRYRPGDRIFLMGYSRGAYAVRSLAGVIDQVGLLRPEHATERNIMQAYRHYQCAPGSPYAADFRRIYCHGETEIEMVGVWDTVKALGLRLPLLRRWTEHQHAFHNHRLGPSIKRGFHALALDETRRVFEPVMWHCGPEWHGRVQQMWFRGTHADIGGQLGGPDVPRGLANLPLVWMLDMFEECGGILPTGWCLRYPTDVQVPSVGTWGSWGKLFWMRGTRVIGRDRSEVLHESARGYGIPVSLTARTRDALAAPYHLAARWRL